MLVNVFGMEVEENEANYWSDYIRNNIKEELLDAILREIGEPLSGRVQISRKIFWQDSSMICGTFKASNGKSGTYSVLKSITPCPVVNLY